MHEFDGFLPVGVLEEHEGLLVLPGQRERHLSSHPLLRALHTAPTNPLRRHGLDHLHATESEVDRSADSGVSSGFRDHAGEVFARLEDRPPGQVPSFAELGRIFARGEVEVPSGSGWVHAGAFAEVGPIAPETHLVPLPLELPPGEVRLRLRLTRGAWKLDRLALAELRQPVRPLAIELAEVRRGEAVDAAALASLRGEEARLTSLPGDRWKLRFVLPPEARGADLFLESRGYYLECIREQWLAEEDLDAAMAFLDDPRLALRRLAPAWKRLEPDAERIFWSSRLSAARAGDQP